MVPYAPSWYSRQNYFWLRNVLQSRWIAAIGLSCWNSMVLPLFLPSWSSWIGRRVEWPFVIFLFLFLIFNFIFLLYNIVLVLPYINMHLPWVYMCSPSRTALPPPSPYHPSGPSQCTSPKLPVSCIEPGLAIHFLNDIIHVLMPFSQIIPCSLSQSPKDCSIHLCLFCCLAYRVIVTIF